MFGAQPAALPDRKPKGPSAGLDSDSRRQESGGSLVVLARALVKHPASGLRDDAVAGSGRAAGKARQR
jgi:hypothetical protein